MSKRMDALEKEERAEKRAAVVRRIGIWLFVLLLGWAVAFGANNRIEVTEYDYANAELPLSFEGFRIVHLSDLHNKIFGQNNEPLLTKLRDLDPNMIVLTGDIVDASTHTDVDAALLFLRQAAQIAPTAYIYGNHEHLLEKSVLADYESKVRETGVIFLSNEEVQIVSDRNQTFTLIGLDDNSLQANILKTLADDALDDFVLLLAHEPQFLEEYYAPAGVDLVLSGHAHGGQFRLPFLHRGLYAPDQGILPKMTEGEFTADGTDMIISRGLGNSAFPLRLLNHPEIVSITLHAAKE